MIILLSHSYFEQGTDPIIDWLLYYKADFIKIAVEDLLNRESEYSCNVNNAKILINHEDILMKIKVVCLRRFYRHLKFPSEDLGDISRKLSIETNYELQYLTNHLFYMLKNKIWLPNPENVNVNKLTVLYIAEKNNIKSPKSLLTNNKKDLLQFYDNCKGQIIIKPINQISYYTTGKYTYSTYTTSLTEEDINIFGDYFFPSLFQEKIEAEYEVRSFYLDGEFFSVAAIVNNSEREVDLKRSFYTSYINWVNYSLPTWLEDKLTNLMKELNLNTGSMDIIMNKKGEYVFLEVNPVGQYGAPSHQGNYYIEKRIAEWLIKKDKLN